MGYTDTLAEQQDRRMHITGRLAIAGSVLVLGLTVLVILIGMLDGNSTRAQIETDRIAACAASEDVVGCLEAVMP